MTVLLIDGVGRVREMEITDHIDRIVIPLERPMTCLAFDALAPLAWEPFPVATFRRSAEASYPPVYRMERP